MNNSNFKVEVSNRDASPIYLQVFAISVLLGWLCLQKSMTNDCRRQRICLIWTDALIHNSVYTEAPACWICSTYSPGMIRKKAGKYPLISFEECPNQQNIHWVWRCSARFDFSRSPSYFLGSPFTPSLWRLHCPSFRMHRTAPLGMSQHCPHDHWAIGADWERRQVSLNAWVKGG